VETPGTGLGVSVFLRRCIVAKLAIVGSRGFEHLKWVRWLVSGLKSTTTVVSGGARGVDRAAEQAARKRGLEVIVHRAEWERFGWTAGYERNKLIVADADGLVAFWDGKSRGTRDSIEQAVRKGIWVRVYAEDGSFVQCISS
jgi:hypothetical protein